MRCARASNFGGRTASIPRASSFLTRPRTRPRSRDLIEACGLDVALDDQSLPHMASVSGAFDGAPLRVARVSFTGDRSYELSVPASRAACLRTRLAEKLPTFGGGLLG